MALVAAVVSRNCLRLTELFMAHLIREECGIPLEPDHGSRTTTSGTGVEFVTVFLQRAGV